MTPYFRRLLIVFFITGATGVCFFVHSLDRPVAEIHVGFMSGMYSNVDPKDAVLATDVLMRQWMKKKGRARVPRSFVMNSMEEAVEQIKEQRLDIIALMANDYLMVRDKIEVEPFLVALRKNTPYDEYVLLARAAPFPRDLARLKGKNIIIDKGNKGNIPQIWLDTLLMKKGLPVSGKFFGSVKSVDKASNAVLPVFFGQADAAIVTRQSLNTINEMNPQVQKGLRILDSVPNILRDVIVMRKNADVDLKETVMQVWTELNSTPEGKQILVLFREEAVVPFISDYMVGTENLVMEYQRLAKATGGGK